MNNYKYLLFPIYYFFLFIYLKNNSKKSKLNKTKDNSTQTDIV